MDGLSVAASVVGLVSLAMQLSQTTRKLVAFLDTIHDEPTEINQGRGRGGYVPGREHIYEMLVVCLQRLSPIQDALNKTESFSLGSGSIVSRSWVKVKLAMKREEILEMERQLEQALTVLNVSLTTTILHMSGGVYEEGRPQEASTTQVVQMKRKKTALGSNFDETDLNFDTKYTNGYKTGFVTSTSSKQYSWLNIVSLSFETRQRRRRPENYNGSAFGAESTTTRYRIWSPLISRSIEITNTSVSDSSPSFGLCLPHIVNYITYLDDIHPVIETKCEWGDFSELFRGGMCSLNTEISFHNFEPGWSYIVDAKVAQCTLDHRWLNHGAQSRFRSLCSEIDLVYYDPEDIIPSPGFPQGSSMHSVPLVLDAIEWLAISGRERSALPIADYLGSLLCLVAVWLSQERNESRNGRTKAFCQVIISRLIKGGADIHYRDRQGRTTLSGLIWSIDPGVIDETQMLSQYLSLLDECQVDVRQYLEEESILNPGPIEMLPQSNHLDRPDRFYGYVRPRKITALNLESGFDSVISVCVDPESPASQLLGYFNFCPDIGIWRGFYCKEAVECINALNSQS
ncbi:hypothetical protein CMUS01_11010 [Colletotrichum musicola]|uniref:Fungal N-terminal domain-containing protein n=1 Tax=Colletotrichum musicola TaxID=2175873 RepID=A0A8H6N6X4_9PEZI|nr:hypothetical protein CMUS01_11010 [Colletotrichum musicola]